MTAFPFVRGWWQSFLSDKGQALLLSMVMLAMFLGVSSSLDTTALTENLVGSRRLIRVLIFSALFLASAFIIMQKPSNIRASGKPVQIMLFYAFLAIVSTSYSINPFLSLWKSFEVLTLVLIIIALSGKIKTLN
ncbi:hypothetical protein KAR91_16675, partial [Candidatus Pacearchaeota archaeon]|nr:hypothetical protein [Candidatus Pacearchaeota archaeon]